MNSELKEVMYLLGQLFKNLIQLSILSAFLYVLVKISWFIMYAVYKEPWI